MFANVKSNISVKSVSVSLQILNDHMIVRRGTCRLVFFGKKLGYKLVLGMSVYHLAFQSFPHCPNSLECPGQFSLELRLL